MGKTTGGLFGKVRGKAGDGIGSSWKGITTVRSMPLSVANPNTAAQQAQRSKFAACILVARLLLADLISTYWNPFAKKMSGFNAFTKKNIDCFAGGVFATPADFFAARGILTGLANMVVNSIAGDLTNITWDDNSGTGDALATDEVLFLMYNETQDVWDLFYHASSIRSEGEWDVPNSPNYDNDDVIRIYGFCARPDISKVSDSIYKTGVAVVA